VFEHFANVLGLNIHVAYVKAVDLTATSFSYLTTVVVWALRFVGVIPKAWP
jgi:hypothetical protein